MLTDSLLTAAPTVLAGDILDLLDEKTSWAETFVPRLLIVVIGFVALVQFVKTSGVIKKAAIVAVAGIVIYALVTNIQAVGDKVGSELDTSAPTRIADSGPPRIALAHRPA